MVRLLHYVAAMANFVLVAGARLGGRAWDEVVPYLRAAGQGAHPLTLSGLADKRGVPAGQQRFRRMARRSSPPGRMAGRR